MRSSFVMFGNFFICIFLKVDIYFNDGLLKEV